MDADLQRMIASLSTEDEPTLSIDQRIQDVFGNLPFFLEDEDLEATGAGVPTFEAPPNTPQDLDTPEPPPAVPVPVRNSTFWKPRRATPYPRGRRVQSRRQVTPPPESVSRRPRSKYIFKP